MALVKEDGNGLSTANSYVTAAEADAYFAAQGNLGWAGTTAFKEQNLINAATAIDALYGARYISYLKDDATQALLWPREQTWDQNGRRIGSGVVPTALLNAQMEMALLAQNGVDLYPSGNVNNNIVNESIQVGEISQSKGYQKAPTEQATYEGFRQVELILRPILTSKAKRIAFAL